MMFENLVFHLLWCKSVKKSYVFYAVDFGLVLFFKFTASSFENLKIQISFALLLAYDAAQ